MILRIVKAAIRQGKGPALESVYRDAVMTGLEQTDGCLFAGLLQRVHSTQHYASLTLWESASHIRAYTDSGSFDRNIGHIRDFLEETSEWQIQLSSEDTIEYVPVMQQPIVESYPVGAGGRNLPEYMEGSRRFMRLLSLKIKPGQEDEFKRIYREEIQTTLKKTTGCRFSVLIDNTVKEREFLSLSIWDDHGSVKLYEEQGAFSSLLKKVRHTLADLYQRKMALESKSKSKYSVTSEDAEISKYTLVTGKKFR
jgi:quinol monooxygenase YgiN